METLPEEFKTPEAVDFFKGNVYLCIYTFLYTHVCIKLCVTH